MHTTTCTLLTTCSATTPDRRSLPAPPELYHRRFALASRQDLRSCRRSAGSGPTRPDPTVPAQPSSSNRDEETPLARGRRPLALGGRGKPPDTPDLEKRREGEKRKDEEGDWKRYGAAAVAGTTITGGLAGGGNTSEKRPGSPRAHRLAQPGRATWESQEQHGDSKIVTLPSIIMTKFFFLKKIVYTKFRVTEVSPNLIELKYNIVFNLLDDGERDHGNRVVSQGLVGWMGRRQISSGREAPLPPLELWG